MIVAGLLLAAGSGSRMGSPKALVLGVNGRPWVVDAARVLIAGGCNRVYVTVGAQGRAVRQALRAESVSVIDVDDWSEGLSTSLRRGLEVISEHAADAVLVHLVDLPDIGSDVVERMCGDEATLARATYDGAPGHPVLIGREHWRALLSSLSGDSGANAYLKSQGVKSIECSDLASGKDIDARSATRSAQEPFRISAKDRPTRGVVEE